MLLKRKIKFNKKRFCLGLFTVALSLCLFFSSLPCCASSAITKNDTVDSLYSKGSIVFNRADTILYRGDEFATPNIWKFRTSSVANDTLIEYGGSDGFEIIRFGTADTFQLDCTTAHTYSDFYNMSGWIDLTYNPTSQYSLSCVKDFEIIFKFAGANIRKDSMNVSLSNSSVEICGARYRWTEQTNPDGSPQYVDYVYTDAGGFTGRVSFDDNLNLVCKGYFDEPVVLSAIRISFTLSVQVTYSTSTAPRLWFRSNVVTATLASRDDYILHAMSRYYTDVLEAYSSYYSTSPNANFRKAVRKYSKAMQWYLYPLTEIQHNSFFNDLFVFLGNAVLVGAAIGVAVYGGSRVFKAVFKRKR